MKKLSIFLVALICVFTLGACGKADDNKMENKNESKMEQSSDKERPAVDFELKDLEGNIHKLEDYKGKKVLIEFWASWCHICVDNMPHISELVKDENKGFEVITVIAPEIGGEQSLDNFKKWFKEKGYTNIPVLVDEGGQLQRAYGVRAFPTNVILDSNHNVDTVIPGAIPDENLRQIFSELK